MSAPKFVNTKDGTCWTRRAATRGGLALYAPESVCNCPEFVMATEVELAELGIVGTADVLPVPVSPAPLTARQKVDEAFGIEARLFQHALDKVFSVLTEGGFLTAPSQIATLKARIAELEAERHTTNESLDDAVQELRARPSCPCPPADQPGPHQLGCPLAEVPSPLFPTVAALREVLDGEHFATVHHDYRVGHDLDMPVEADPGDRLLGGDGLRRAVRGHLFGGGA